MTVLWSDLHSTVKGKVPWVMTELQKDNGPRGLPGPHPQEMPQYLSISAMGDLLPRASSPLIRGHTLDDRGNLGDDMMKLQVLTFRTKVQRDF